MIIKWWLSGDQNAFKSPDYGWHLCTHTSRGRAKHNEHVCKVLFDNSSREDNESVIIYSNELNEAQVEGVATKCDHVSKICILYTLDFTFWNA